MATLGLESKSSTYGFQCIGIQRQFRDSLTLIDESCLWDADAAAAIKVFPYNGDQKAAEQFRALIKGKIWAV